MLTETGLGSPEQIEKAKADSNGLGLFVRSLVGLDRQAAKKALDQSYIPMLKDPGTKQNPKLPKRLASCLWPSRVGWPPFPRPSQDGGTQPSPCGGL